MKNDISDILKSLDKIFLDNDIEAPIRSLQNEHSDKILKFLEYRYNASLKMIDVLIDVLKVFLSVSGSLLIAIYTIESITVNSIYLERILIFLFITLLFLLIIRTRISNDAIAKYNSFLDMDAENLKNDSSRYFEGLREKVKLLKERYKILSKEHHKNK